MDNKQKELIIRFLGFLLPWLAFSLLQYFVLKIQQPYNLMLFGGVAALVSLSVRDWVLEKLLNSDKRLAINANEPELVE